MCWNEVNLVLGFKRAQPTESKIIKHQKKKISIEFPQYFICLRYLTKFRRGFLDSSGSSMGKALQLSSQGGAS